MPALRNSLPPPPGEIVGRGEDLDALRARFGDDERLITVTGPGGIGKTRLALELGRTYRGVLGDDDEPGVWLVDLTGARDAAGLCDAIADALDVADPPPGGEAVALLGEAMAARGEVLLILDNFEHLIAHAPDTVGRWLAMAPELRVLVTSRERLDLPGEIVHELGPLGVPDEDGPVASDAFTFFVACVRRLRRDYDPDPEEARRVADIVRTLDGIPLAIELAAPRLTVMGARALLHRLRSRFDVLRRRDRGVPARHATLEAAIDGSYQALEAWEQAALAMCSVFRGGFGLEAAEAVIDLSAFPAAPPVLDVVQSLRDKSLLRAVPTRGGDLRLSAYEAIREYASRRLDEAGTRAETVGRHAAHYVETAERRITGVEVEGGAEAHHALLLERENLLAVVDRVLSARPVTARTAEPALRALLALAPVLLTRGPVATFAALIEPALEATAASGADPRLQGRALAVRARMHRLTGDLARWERDSLAALGLARQLGDRALEAQVLHEGGRRLLDAGDLEGAERHLEQATALAGLGPDLSATLGRLRWLAGRPEEARAELERALAGHTAQDHVVGQARDRRLLGELTLALGEHDVARDHLERALQLCERAQDRLGHAQALTALGLLAHDTDQLDEARDRLERAAEESRDRGFRNAHAIATGHLGVLSRWEGRTTAADTWLREACAVPTELRVVFLAHRAALAADVGRDAEARRLLEEARQDGDARAAPILALAAAHLHPSGAARALDEARDPAARSVLVRLTARCLSRIGDRGAAGPPPPPDDALLVADDASWFRPPRADRVDLSRRRPLRRLLQRLVAQRLSDARDEPLAWDDLLAAGWPDERVMAASGAHRVRVAVSTLRKLGLKDVLLTHETGYALATAVDTRQVS